MQLVIAVSYTHLKDKLPSNPDPNLEKIQLKHLLCMSSGFGKALLMNAARRPGVGPPDYEKSMMAQPVPVEPRCV